MKNIYYTFIILSFIDPSNYNQLLDVTKTAVAVKIKQIILR